MKGQLQVKNKRRRSMRVSCSMKSVFYEGKKSCEKYAHIKPGLFFLFFPTFAHLWWFRDGSWIGFFELVCSVDRVWGL